MPELDVCADSSPAFREGPKDCGQFDCTFSGSALALLTPDGADRDLWVDGIQYYCSMIIERDRRYSESYLILKILYHIVSTLAVSNLVRYFYKSGYPTGAMQHMRLTENPQCQKPYAISRKAR